MSRNKKPPKDSYSPYKIVQVPPETAVKFVCQSREWEGLQTHWYGNHSVRCPGEMNCDLCIERIPTVWKGYLFGQAVDGGNTAMFQLTPLAAFTLEELTESKRGLLGAIISLKRAGRRKNSPLEASIRGFDRSVKEIPFEALERTVSVIYREYNNGQKPLKLRG